MDVALVQRIRGLDPLTVWHGIHADTVNHNPPRYCGDNLYPILGLMALDLVYLNSGRVPAGWWAKRSGQVGPRGGAVLGWSSSSSSSFGVGRLGTEIGIYSTGCQEGLNV